MFHACYSFLMRFFPGDVQCSQNTCFETGVHFNRNNMRLFNSNMITDTLSVVLKHFVQKQPYRLNITALLHKNTWVNLTYSTGSYCDPGIYHQEAALTFTVYHMCSIPTEMYKTNKYTCAEITQYNAISINVKILHPAKK